MADQGQTSQVQHIAQEWEKFVTGQVAQLETVLNELGKNQSKVVSQALISLEETGRFAKESLALAERAGNEWRKLAIETARRTAQLVTPAVKL